MRLLCLLFLAACASVPHARAACFKGFSDAEPAQPLRPARAQTWAQMEADCAAGFPGRSLLQFVDSMTDADRGACEQSVVPFGVYQIGRPGINWPPLTFYWSGGSKSLDSEDLVNLTYPAHGTAIGVAVIDLTTGRWEFVPKSQTFECALCQMAMVDNMIPPEAPILPEDVTFLSRFMRQVVFEIVVAVGAKIDNRVVSELPKNFSSTEEELGKLFGVTHEKIQFSHITDVGRSDKELYFRLTSESFDDVHLVGDKVTGVLGVTVGREHEYEVRRVRMVSPCPVEEFPEGYQPVVREFVSGIEVPDPKFCTFGDLQVLVNPEREQLSQRQCVWNKTAASLEWSRRTHWNVLWKNCSAEEQFYEDSSVQSNLKAIFTRRTEKKLEQLPQSPNCTVLEEVAELVNFIVTKNNNLTERIQAGLFSRLPRTKIDVNSDFCLVDKARLKLVVSDLKVTSPVLGLKLDQLPQDQRFISDKSFVIIGEMTTPSVNDSTDDGIQMLNYAPFATSPDNVTDDLWPSSENMTAELKNPQPEENYNQKNVWEIVPKTHVIREAFNSTDTSTDFAIMVSESLSEEFQQLTVAVVARKVRSNNGLSVSEAYEQTVYIELSTDTTIPSLYLDDDNYYIDIAYPFVEDTVERQGEIFRTSCVSWNPLTEAWSTMACRKRNPELRDALTVCRCRSKHMSQDGGTLKGVFAVKRAINSDRINSMLIVTVDSSEIDIFQYACANGVRKSFTVFLCVISSTGLLSLVLTAIFYKQWREEVDHKILLQLVMAITINLAISVINDYMHLDTEGVGCIIIGVLRHYSFLAMFLWMLVMSGLQMKRLMTVEGEKATSFLALKLAVFAWGVPFLPIIVLLAWKARIYRSDRYDRGFCYPEGIFFQVTVQAPAAFILSVNLLVFVAILRHIFECCSGEKITKHTKNERAQQMRRVATSVFIFFLFGFTWVLHYLSEERLIRSDFLFECLFLMTATTHISVLALFFVVLDDKARAFWLEAVKGKVCFFR